MSAVPLADAGDADAFGGKAAQLAAALRAGLPVPPAVALPAASAARVAAGDAAARRALDAALGVLGGARFAVRSSAAAEDGARASFAGQHRTCLNVPRARVAEAVAEVWRSSAAAPAAAYRARVGLADGEAGGGVVVQELVAADVAGVLFTRDPVRGTPERVVEASWGLGEAVVAGHVVPDRFRLAPDGAVLERTAGVKDRVVFREEGGGTALADLAGADVGRLCLGDAELAALGALAGACETAFGGPRDVEWAFAGGRLWLLQARAITAGR